MANLTVDSQESPPNVNIPGGSGFPGWVDYSKFHFVIPNGTWSGITLEMDITYNSSDLTVNLQVYTTTEPDPAPPLIVGGFINPVYTNVGNFPPNAETIRDYNTSGWRPIDLARLTASQGGILGVWFAFNGEDGNAVVHRISLIFSDFVATGGQKPAYGAGPWTAGIMGSQCEVAHASVYDRLDNATFPIAYVINDQMQAGWQFLSPGLMSDSGQSINGDIGIRVYKGQFGNPNGWRTSGQYDVSNNRPIWVQPAGIICPIPWNNDDLSTLLEFYTDGRVFVAPHIEFALVPFEALRNG